MRLLRGKPSPTQLVAWLALFIALGGTGYAATQINGKTIKKGSIPANRIKADSLGGAQVNEASLATVPSASRAVTADRAVTAQATESAERAQTADDVATAERAERALFAGEAGTAEEADRAGNAVNALLLGGIPASDFQVACAQGIIRGIAVIRETGATFGSTCAGTAPTITELSLGRFRIEFTGLTGRGVAVANSRFADTVASIAPDETVPFGSPPTFTLTISEPKPPRFLAAQVFLF